MMLNFYNICGILSANGTVNKLSNSVLSTVSIICGTIVAIVMVVMIASTQLKSRKGEGKNSQIKIISEFLVLCLALGLIFIAASWNQLGNKAKDIGNKGIDIISGGLNEVMD